jgi:hypothetical protein
MIAYCIFGNYLLSYDENAVGAAASSLDCLVRSMILFSFLCFIEQRTTKERRRKRRKKKRIET